MAEIKPGMIIILLVGAFLIFGQGNGATQAPTTTTIIQSPPVSAAITQGCGIEPTFELLATDKFDSGLATNANERIIRNGATPETYTGSSTAAALNDKIKILWGFGNTTFNKDVTTETITKCGKNLFANNNLVRNTTSMTFQCYNEEGDVISAAVTGTVNESVGTGDEVTLRCQIIGIFERGFTNGGVIVVEANGTTWDESRFEMTGSIIEGKATVPTAYDLNSAGHKTRAFSITPIVGTGTRDFDFTFKAEDTRNPAGTDSELSQSSMNLTIYQADCFENSETHDFECAVEDEDGNFVSPAVVARETIWVS